jgi:hypothetical protein
MPPAVLGTVRARDSSSPPDDEAGLPWHVILAAIAIYLLGRAEWHWLYILPVLWLLKCAEDQRRRRLWNRLYATASAAVASVNTSESVTWLNQIFRAVWQMYERPIGRYALAILQTKVNQNIPKRIGVTAVTLKSFSFGAVEARRSDGRFRIAPVILENVYMVDKRVEPSRDPLKEKIRYLFRSDVRWQTGPSSKLLELAIKHRLVPFDTVDVEVSDLMLEGTLEIEFVFMRSYPWLCHVAFSFVQPPSVHFKLSLGASLNALDLMPKLRSWLDDLIESTLTETMVGDNKYTIPLFEWYGEDQDKESPERQASRPSASHPNGPSAAGAAGIRARSAPRGRERERAPPLRPEGPSPMPPTHAANVAAQAGHYGSSGGTGVLRPEAARSAHAAALGHTGVANASSSQRWAAGQAEVADGERRRHRTGGSGSPPTVGASPQRRSAATKKHAANGCGAGPAAVEVMSESAFFGSDGLDGASEATTVGVPGLWSRDSIGVERTPIATYLNDEQTGDVLATWASERPPETPEPYRGIGSTGICGGSLCSLLGVQPPPSPTNLKVSPLNNARDLARASPGDIAAAAAAAQAMTPRQPLPRTATVATPDSATWSAGIGSAFASAAAAAAAAAGYQMAWHDDRPEWILDPQLLRAARAEEMARGAVGELIVHLTHVAGLVLDRPSRLASSLGPFLAASLYVHLAVGDGAEQRGKLLSASAVHAAASGGTSGTTPSRGADADAISAAEAEGHFVVNQSESCFRLCVHDSLTQKLRMRLSIKEIAVELKELGSAELALAALRVNVPALHAVPLPLAGRQEPAMIHLQVTFRLLT